MKKYKSFADFDAINGERFAVIQRASSRLKSPGSLGSDEAMGLVLAEAETLSHFFLNCANIVTELMFGLSASVLDASAEVSAMEGVLYGQKTGGATDKRMAVSADPLYADSVRKHNELVDLKKYLENKRDDFMANHYYYKGLCSGGNR